MPTISAGEIKRGYILNHNNSMWKVISTEHVKPGKGGAFMQTEMKNIKTGTKLNERFRTEDKVDRLIMETVDAQFSYSDPESASFLRLDTYESVTIDKSDIGNDLWPFLIDDIKVKIEMIDEGVVGVSFPETVVLTVTETEPQIKGATATNVNKPAKLSNGISISVPSFITEGEKIVVSTQTFEYIERA